MAHRILIVEDNPVDQRLFEQALSEPGREIEVCSDGREALAAFERRAADLVVSDIMMPNMEGLELLSELHRRVPGLPVILVTRFGNIPAAVAAMRDGAFDYVTKPVEVFELQTRVKRALEINQLLHENDTLRQELSGRSGPDSVVAESVESRKLMELVRRIAASHSTVLTQGPRRRRGAPGSLRGGLGRHSAGRPDRRYQRRVPGQDATRVAGGRSAAGRW